MSGRPSRRALLVGALSASITLAACVPAATPPPREGNPPPVLSDPAAEIAYQNTLGKWVRRAEIYEALDSRLFVGAAFETMELRKARVSRIAAFQMIPEPDVRSMLDREHEEHEKFIEFTLGVHANERRWDDLGRPNSIWRLALVSDAGEALPIEVKRLHRPDENLRALYPFIGEFWSVYRVRFPMTFANGVRVLPDGLEHFTLRLASSVGHADLVFDPEDAARPSAAR